MAVLIHQGALGDWVVTFPLLRALGKNTVAVTHWSKARLAARLIPGVVSMDIEQREFSRLHSEVAPAALGPAIAQMFADSDLIISFVSNGADAWARNVKAIAPKAKLAFVAPRPTQAWHGHIGDWHLHELATQGVTIDPVAPRDAKRSEGPIVLHPGSGGRDKCWPIDRFAALAAALRAAGHVVQPILGEVEVANWPAAQLRQWSRAHDARVIDTLDQLTDAMAGARLYIGNDSGPTHLASQMGLPTLALFGPSSPTMWAPRGPGAAVLAPAEPSNMDWLDVDKVTAAATAMLA